MKLFPQGKRGWRNVMLRILTLCALLGLALVGMGFYVTTGPGEGHQGPLPAYTDTQKATAKRLHADVQHLSVTIGARDAAEHPAKLKQAEAWVYAQLRQHPAFTVERRAFTVRGAEVANIVATLPGSEPGVIVFGAHYDSVPTTPGADDNASGVAVLLELARRAALTQPKKTLKLVAFVNEEPPYFKTEAMGSLVFAREEAKAGVAIEAMISLEMLGTYSDAAHSQKYPPGVGAFYPNTGNFVAFVGDLNARSLVHGAVATFRRTTAFPSEVISAPAFVPGVDFSDHWSFWQAGYPNGIMVTDTAFNRTPHYHEPTDTIDRLNFPRMAIVTDGMEQVLLELVGLPTK
jgi:Zn-dependent M28 family amino/carboxypeptidase